MIRQHSGKIINATKAIQGANGELLDSALLSAGSQKPLTLSLYNKTETYRNRPQTAPANHNLNNGINTAQSQPWLKLYDQLAPVPEELGDTIEQRDLRLPDFKPPSALSLPARTMAESLRQEQLSEIEAIKDRLAKDNCSLSILTLQKAILMPEDLEYKPGVRVYPKIEQCLMPNTFPKKKKKKGSKKKKGKK